MQTEKHSEMEKFICDFIDKINRESPDTLCGLLRPSFVCCDGTEKSLTMAYPAQYWEQNLLGRMHGGTMASLLDFTAGLLAIYESRTFVLTVSMQVSYLRPGPVDGRVLVKARSTKSGRTLLHSFAEAWCEDAPDKLIASANCVYIAGEQICASDTVTGR